MATSASFLLWGEGNSLLLTFLSDAEQPDMTFRITKAAPVF
jgi:hypothetical protein